MPSAVRARALGVPSFVPSAAGPAILVSAADALGGAIRSAALIGGIVRELARSEALAAVALTVFVVAAGAL